MYSLAAQAYSVLPACHAVFCALGLLAAAATLWLRRRRMRRCQLPRSSPPPKDTQQRPFSSSFTSSHNSRDGFGARLCQEDSATEATLRRKLR
jgi:hypothetical protein